MPPSLPKIPERANLAVALTLFFLVPILSRHLALEKEGLVALPVDYVGFLSGLVFSGLLFSLVALFRGVWQKLLMVILLGVVGLLEYINLDSIQALGSPVNFAFSKYAMDESFLKGVTEKLLNPSLFVAVVVAPMTLALFLRPVLLPRKGLLGFLGFALLGAIFVESYRPAISSAAWRQYHFSHINLKQQISDRSSAVVNKPEALQDVRQHSSLDEASRAAVLQTLKGDVTGVPLAGFEAGTNPNVLLVILEGISGAHFARLSEEIGGGSIADSKVSMAASSEAMGEALWFSSFIAYNRQTNRGEYALLCGDYPNLAQIESKMDIYVYQKRKKRCLPQVLREHGYLTAYIQAAHLSFMAKDRFMASSGFEVVEGKNHFDKSRAYAWGGWGPDDRAFLEQSLEKIQSIDQSSQKPWFITLLTAGTHHPYRLPGAQSDGGAESGFAEAAQYLDRALAEFIKGARAEGLLENTILIVTADESRGYSQKRGINKFLSEHWIPLIIKAPVIEDRTIATPFAQADLALSIVDLLGIENSDFSGRSLFRRYSTERKIFWGNILRRKIYMLSEDGGITACSHDLFACNLHAAVKERHLFFRDERSVLSPSAAGSQIHYFLAHNEWLTDRELAGGSYSIGRPAKFAAKNSQKVSLTGDQLLAVAAGTPIEAVVRLRVLQGIFTVAGGLYDGYTDETQPIHRLEGSVLKAGQTLTVLYTHTSTEAIDRLQIVTEATLSSAEGAIELLEAHLKLGAGSASESSLSLEIK